RSSDNRRVAARLQIKRPLAASGHGAGGFQSKFKALTAELHEDNGTGYQRKTRLLRSSGRGPQRQRAGAEERLPQTGHAIPSRSQSGKRGSGRKIQRGLRSLRRAGRWRQASALRPLRTSGRERGRQSV